MGKKIIDFVTQRDASRGRKSKAGGKKIKSDSRIYTPGKDHVKLRVYSEALQNLRYIDRSPDRQTDTTFLSDALGHVAILQSLVMSHLFWG